MGSFRLDRGQIEVVDDIMAEILRRKTPAERIRIACDLWVSVHRMLITHLTKTHPDWDSKRVEQEVARRLSHGTV
jgi:Rv0078B-related antitoxin